MRLGDSEAASFGLGSIGEEALSRSSSSASCPDAQTQQTQRYYRYLW